MAETQKKPPIEQPELPNIPPKPQEIKQVYMVTMVQHKNKVYCRVDFNNTAENKETLGEIYNTVRQLERVLNKLKKSNIQLQLNTPPEN